MARGACEQKTQAHPPDQGVGGSRPLPSARDGPGWGPEIFLTATDRGHIREETQHRVADLMGLEGREKQADQVPEIPTSPHVEDCRAGNSALAPGSGRTAGWWERGPVRACLSQGPKTRFGFSAARGVSTKLGSQTVPFPHALRGPALLLSEGPRGALRSPACRGWLAHSPSVSCTCGSPLL